jgi:hypothetical protein
LITNGIKAVRSELQDISDAALREHSLEKQLDKMMAEWVCVLECQTLQRAGSLPATGSVRPCLLSRLIDTAAWASSTEARIDIVMHAYESFALGRGSIRTDAMEEHWQPHIARLVG